MSEKGEFLHPCPYWRWYRRWTAGKDAPPCGADPQCVYEPLCVTQEPAWGWEPQDLIR